MSSQGIANPAPLGLAGFGFTTVLLNLVNVGLGGAETLFVRSYFLPEEVPVGDLDNLRLVKEDLIRKK